MRMAHSVMTSQTRTPTNLVTTNLTFLWLVFNQSYPLLEIILKCTKYIFAINLLQTRTPTGIRVQESTGGSAGVRSVRGGDVGRLSTPVLVDFGLEPESAGDAVQTKVNLKGNLQRLLLLLICLIINGHASLVMQ